MSLQLIEKKLLVTTEHKQKHVGLISQRGFRLSQD